MDKDTFTISRYQKLELELLQKDARIRELEARLAKYELLEQP